MADNMVQFDKNDIRFILCSRGIVIHRERVLLFNVIGWDWWALPGGRAEMLERSDEALKREWREELNTAIDINRLVWVNELFFKHEGRTHHEICMYYSITVPQNSNVLDLEEHTCKDGLATLRFKWFPLSNLEQLHIRPLFLNKGLLNLPIHTENIIWYDK